MTIKHTDGIYSIEDLIFFNATAEDIEEAKQRVAYYLGWLRQMGKPNTLDNWEAFNEMVSAEEE